MLIRCAVVAISLVAAWPAKAQSTSTTAELTLLERDPTCTVSGTGPDFGSYYRPVSGTGSVSITATTGSVGSPGGGMTLVSTGSVGSFSVTWEHADNFTVSVSSPSSLGSGGPSYSGTWAESSTASGSYSSASGSHSRSSLGGEGKSGSHHYRIGGDVTGVSTSMDGTYSGTITVSVSCS